MIKTNSNFFSIAIFKNIFILLTGSWCNPFMASTSIVSLSSGITASAEVQEDLLKAEEVGQSCLDGFVKDRVESSNVGFYETIKKNQLKTFDVKKNTLIMKVKDQKIAIRADRETFGRLLSIQQKMKCRLEGSHAVRTWCATIISGKYRWHAS